jgi:hypothetical protein
VNAGNGVILQSPDANHRCNKLVGGEMAKLVCFWTDYENDRIKAKEITTPMLKLDKFEILNLENNKRDKWEIKKKLFTQRVATIFTVTDREDVLLKYEINCDSPNAIHPLVKEAIILSLVGDLGISPKFFYLSAPQKFIYDPRSVKTQVRSQPWELRKCARESRSVVRVIAMENAGTSVAVLTEEKSDLQKLKAHGFDKGYPRGLPLREALEIGIKLLQNLEKLHGKGIAHGDVHAGNVAVKRGVKEKFEVKLIDYGFAFFPKDYVKRKIQQRTPFSLIHIFYSPWFLRGERHGFRDDLFDAMNVFAVLVNGDSFTQYCINLAAVDRRKRSNGIVLNEKTSELFKFKNTAKYFQIPSFNGVPARNPLTGLAAPIQDNLNHAIAKARNQPDVNAQAPIAAVRAHLEAALKLVRTGN